MADVRASRRRPKKRLQPSVERALRAAADPQPLWPPGFGLWVLGRLLAMALLVGAAWLVYDSASSDRFRVRSVDVQGNVLLSRAELEDVAAVTGANILWVNRAQVAARLERLPIVQRAEVTATLPDTLTLHIVERRPAAFWTSGDQSYLVDSEGVILKAVDAETQQARACAGQPCDPRLAALPTVAQVEGQPLAPGDHVDASALSTSARLASLLPSVGVVPVSFTWSPATGLEVPTRDGFRARFDESGDLDRQIASLRAIREQLSRTRTAAEVIDVRFGDRPYFR